VTSPAYRPPRPRERGRPRGRSVPLRRLAAVAGVVVVFGFGIALGEALHDNPKPDGSRTIVRTLRPLPLAPAPVTVTVRP
jgi:hypothetical protein